MNTDSTPSLRARARQSPRCHSSHTCPRPDRGESGNPCSSHHRGTEDTEKTVLTRIHTDARRSTHVARRTRRTGFQGGSAHRSCPAQSKPPRYSRKSLIPKSRCDRDSSLKLIVRTDPRNPFYAAPGRTAAISLFVVTPEGVSPRIASDLHKVKCLAATPNSRQHCSGLRVRFCAGRPEIGDTVLLGKLSEQCSVN